MVSLLGGGLRNAVGNMGEDGHTHKQAKSIGLKIEKLITLIVPNFMYIFLLGIINRYNMKGPKRSF